MNYIEVNIANKTYQCRLSSRAVCQLEDKLKTNPINILLSTQEGKLPKLNDLLMILHASMTQLNHSITMDDVYEMWDEHLRQGGKLQDLIEAVIAIFQHSGLLTSAKSEAAD